MPKIISPSQINLYRSCPRNYYLKYVANIKSPVESPQLEFGSKIHSMISKRNFVSEDIREQEMLTRAQKFLETLPPGGLIETNFEDRDNPARFFGNIFGHRAISVFDQLWEPDDCVGLDWKTGSLKSSYTDSYEIQGYFLNELYKQKYGKALKRLPFIFLANDKVYEPKILVDEKIRAKTERSIKKVLLNIEEEKYDKKCSGLCSWCEMSMFCPLDI